MVFFLAFVISILIASFLEYLFHRFMHKWLLRKRHADHHADGLAQGWLGEFRDYMMGAIWLLFIGFLHSPEVGWGCFAGGLLFTVWCAYNHQLQHEHPELCVWMPQPVHYTHHHFRMWDANFGIAVDIWDRLFGTYRRVEWHPDRSKPIPLKSYFRIKWI